MGMKISGSHMVHVVIEGETYIHILLPRGAFFKGGGAL